jgi:hypothetical protein
MMFRRRVIAVTTALAFALVGSAANAQQTPKQDTKKRSKQEQLEIEQLVKMVDAVQAGQPAPGDIQFALTPYFLKSQEQRTFVPFVLEVKNAPPTDTAMYVRVVNPSAQPDPKTKRIEYPWDDIHFLTAAQMRGLASTTVTATTTQTAPNQTQTTFSATSTPAGVAGKINRVFMAAPGTYDVYIAMKERLPEKAQKTQVPKAGVLKTQVTVPDYWNAELATSSIIVTDNVNVLSAAPSAEEGRERPFVFGSQELVPAADLEFKKSEQLATFFQVYNAGLGTDGKPNIVMEYNFHRKEGGAEKFFNKTNPQTINASNLPPTFDPSKFPVPGGIEVPLASFPEGEYRLEIKISDKASGKTLTKDVLFTVKGA